MITPSQFWAIFLCLGGAVLLLAYLGGRRRRLTAREVEQATGPAGCGRCGYDVRGLPGRVCPECGGDLDVVGRFAPQFRNWQHVPVAARGLIWVAFVVVLGGTTYRLAVEMYAPAETRFSLVNTIRGRPADPYRYKRVELWVMVEAVTHVPVGQIEDNAGPGRPLPNAHWTRLTIKWLGPNYTPADPPPDAAELFDLPYEAWVEVNRTSATALVHAAVSGGPPTVSEVSFEDARPLRAPLRRLFAVNDIDFGDDDWRPMLETLDDLLGQRLDRLDEGEQPPDAALNGDGPIPLGRWLLGRWRFGGGFSSRPAPWVGAVAAGYWVLVGLAGLPFVLRRQRIRPRPLEPAAATGATLPGAADVASDDQRR